MKRQDRAFPTPSRLTWRDQGDGLASSDGRFAIRRARGGWLLVDVRPTSPIGERWVRSRPAGQRMAEEILETEAQKAPSPREE